ncbi:helix-turn-helix domain-containing protein [Candidatus Phytoplasma sacchari]|uniref:Helix-turn-helix domain-containing protein n=1 Tax=Candidatus Phytoplasma sacchari TaxID=2609813 RepID=A0ABY7M0Q4_9MOLU|nr:helix-turn-helix domain-containing protein [Candidatus Phytoplasma sacchari]
MSPKIIKYYSLETKKAVVKAKLQGIKDKEIVKQFGLSYNSLIYNWLKKFKINNYPDTRTQYSLETKLKVIWAKKEGALSFSQVRKFKLILMLKTIIKLKIGLNVLTKANFIVSLKLEKKILLSKNL